MNQGEKQVEGSVYDSRRIVWTNCNVFWTYKLFSDISNNDEQNSSEFD